jgi:hypothetical protein
MAWQVVKGRPEKPVKTENLAATVKRVVPDSPGSREVREKAVPTVPMASMVLLASTVPMALMVPKEHPA